MIRLGTMIANLCLNPPVVFKDEWQTLRAPLLKITVSSVVQGRLLVAILWSGFKFSQQSDRPFRNGSTNSSLDPSLATSDLLDEMKSN